MDLASFFESENVLLPRGGFHERTKTFDSFLADIFEAYQHELQSIDDPNFRSISTEIKNSIGTVQQLSEQIVCAVKHYLRGFPHQAYCELEKSLESIGIEALFSDLSAFTNTGQPINDPYEILSSKLHPPLYRIRANRAATSSGFLSKKDIFHVPFEIRSRVANQRYSIAGLPCLYLGSSLWICWEELGRPSLDSISVSRFRLAETIRVLDFHYDPGSTWKLFKWAHDSAYCAAPLAGTDDVCEHYNEKFLENYTLCWPLIAACSIKSDPRDGPFYPQYIVPQLLLQWVTAKSKVDGIRYFSTRTDPKFADAYAHSNCVFPAREIANTGHCSYLRKKFTLTEPITWEMLETYNDRRIIATYPTNALARVRLSNDLVFQYSDTDFFSAETRLEHIERVLELSKSLVE